MSIEDVEHLLKNSEQSSLSIFIDSKMRNMLAYPTPSKYVLDFDEPIKHVFGLEMIDVTIPVTEYTIDTSSCTLAISQIFLVSGVALEEFVLAERTDTYATYATLNEISMMKMCSGIPMFLYFLSEPADANFFVCRDRWLYDSMTDVITDEVTSNMIIYIKKILISDLLIYEHADVNEKYESDTRSGSDWQIEMYDSFSTFIIYSEWKYCLDDAAETYAKLYQTDDVPYDVFLCNKYMSVDVGNYDSTALLAKLKNKLFAAPNNRFATAADSMSGIMCNFTDNPDPGTNTATQTIYFQSARPFWFDMQKSTLRAIIGFSQYATVTSSQYSTFRFRPENYQIFMSIEYANGTHKVIAPGLVNIENARYVILRCPEIENHMLGSYASFKYTPGLGLLKMAEANTMMNLRFDFVNIARRPFHPIGKLSRLTFSFEKPDGTLYDFKGIDHLMLLSLKYYSPKNMHTFDQSSLNPYYIPDMIKYQTDKNEAISKGKGKGTMGGKNLEDLLIEQQKYM
jgi:hypothetical protein